MKKNWILATAVASVLAACGGGSSSGGGSSAASSVNGGASKGIIIGGVVNAYAIDDSGQVDKSQTLAEPTTTADDGSYSLTLNSNYSGGALWVEITTAEGTVMRCDLAVCQRDGNGAPTVSFGEDYPLASDFSLSAVLPEASGSVSASITPLTSTAAALALSKVASGARPADAAAAANAQVASRFGLASNDLTAQPIIDITSAAAVNGASKEQLDYNLKAAAAVAAALGDGETVEQALGQFVEQYKNAGVADYESTADDDAASIEEILQQAQVLLDKVKALDGVDNAAVEEADTELEAETAEARNSGSDQPSQGEVPDDVGSEGLRASKQFVAQLRDLASAGLMEDDSGARAFGEQLEMAGEVLSADAETVVEGLARALNAISYAYEAYAEAAEEGEPAPTSYSHGDGILVTIAETAAGVQYSVEESVLVGETSVAVDVVAADEVASEFTETQTLDGDTETTESAGSISGSFTLNGSAASSTVRLAIAEDSGFSATLHGESTFENTEVESDSGYSDDEVSHEELTVNDLEISLGMTLSQLTGENPVSFEGLMTIDIEDFSSASDETYHDSYDRDEGYDFSIDQTTTSSLGGFEWLLSGRAFDQDGSELSASIALQADNFSMTCTDQRSSSSTSPYQAEGECELDETEESYGAANVTVSFGLEIAGVADKIAVTASGTRSGLREAELDLELRYGGKSLTLAHVADLSEEAAEGGSVTVSNHNDVVMTLNEDADGELSGVIEQDGVQYAVIDEDAGAPMVTYSDGEFETL